MRRIIILISSLILTGSLYAQSSLAEQEQQIQNEYAKKEAILQQRLNDARRQYQDHIQEGKSAYEAQDRYDFITSELMHNIQALEQQINNLHNEKNEAIQRARDMDRTLQEKLRAVQQEQIKQQRAQRSQQAQQEQLRRERELESKRRREREERERRRQQEEYARQVKFQNDYNDEIRRTSGHYADSRSEVNWMASQGALNRMNENMSRTRLQMSIHDVEMNAPQTQVTSSSAINRLKDRKTKANDKAILPDNENPVFDEASLFTLSYLNQDVASTPSLEEWPYASRIPITQTQQTPLYSYEESTPVLPSLKNNSGLNDEFNNTLSTMDVDDLHYVKQTYEEYCELSELADYSYHEKPLSAELAKNGWLDVSTENNVVKRICSEAETGGSSINGLKMSVLRNGDRYVISFGGTDFNFGGKEFLKDVKTDIVGEFFSDEEQVRRAKDAVNKLIKEGGIPIEKIEFTGHSLGGRIASEMSVEFIRPATTYNAAGVTEQTRNRYEKLVTSNGNYLGIRNITTEHDFLTNMQESTSATSPCIKNSLVKKVYSVASVLSPSAKASYYISYADKRALGAKVILPDAVGYGEAHKLSTIKDGLYSRYNSVLNAIETTGTNSSTISASK